MSNVLVNISKLFLILLNKKSKIAKHRCEQNTIKTHVWKTAMSVTKKNGKNTAVENTANAGKYHCGKSDERGQEKITSKTPLRKTRRMREKPRCKTDEKATGELQGEEGNEY